MHRNKSVDVHRFAMVPRSEIPRSAFLLEHCHKTTFDAGYLIPVYLEEVLPGDTLSLRMTAFARMATPLYPLMDNLHLDSFFFFVPFRLLWEHWRQFMGEQLTPGDSISYVIPYMDCPAGGYNVGSLYDYLGLPTVGQVGAGNQVRHSALPLRAYALIFNEWFRDENLMAPHTRQVDDGPDAPGDYALARRGKRHDYFTSCLPWPQKGATSVSLPLGTSAPVLGNGKALGFYDGTQGTGAVTGTAGLSGFVTGSVNTYGAAPGTASGGAVMGADKAVGIVGPSVAAGAIGAADYSKSGLYADLSTATAATINQLRQSFQIQKLLERDARGGTRYTEIVRAHFGVVSPDARLQRPEYLGGGSTPIVVNPIAQTSGTSAAGTTTPLGNLAAMATALAHGHGFSQSFTEHGLIMGLVNVRADLTYQQGLRRMWSRSTRYDFYFPVFAALGEQSVLNKEIYCDGSANDSSVFGYQERWAEYRYHPSEITGLFRSTSAGTIDGWHLAQKFTALPTLAETFISDTPPVSRVVAVGTGANGQQFIFDSLFSVRAVRPMPMYSVPGLIDHF